MKDTTLAHRYAKALYDLASAKSAELKVEEDLRAILKAIQSDVKTKACFQSPALKAADKSALLKKTVENKTEPLVHQFASLLIFKNRFNLLDLILDAYHEILNRSRHFEEVVITSAQPLRSELRRFIEEALEKKIGEKIVSEVRVNPKLLGGITIQIRYRLFDGSIRTKLDDLRKQMIEAEL